MKRAAAAAAATVAVAAVAAASLAVAGAGLDGCAGKPVTGILLTVTFDMGLGIDQLEVMSLAPALPRDDFRPETPGGPLASGATVGIVVPDDFAGQELTITVHGRANALSVAQGEVSVTLVLRETVTASVALSGAGGADAGVDGGVPSLDAGLDSAVDSGVGTDGGSSTCMNGAIDGTEQCDPTATPPVPGGATCAIVTACTRAAGSLACSPSCLYDTSGCTDTCPDGIVQTCEDCDGTNLNGATCVSIGFAGGTLSCSTTNCSFDTSGCM